MPLKGSWVLSIGGFVIIAHAVSDGLGGVPTLSDKLTDLTATVISNTQVDSA